MKPATNEPLPLELPGTEPAVTCWYCGSARGPFEREHQLPVSHGGGETGATALVWADARRNALKGPLDVEEFREGLAERLGLDPAQVVFAGEATPERPATRLQAVRSLQADRSVVRIDPIAGDELNKAWRWLRAALDPNLTKRDVATEAILSHLAELRARYVGEDEWPDPGLYLFDLEDRPLPTGTAEAVADTQGPPSPRAHQGGRRAARLGPSSPSVPTPPRPAGADAVRVGKRGLRRETRARVSLAPRIPDLRRSRRQQHVPFRRDGGGTR